MTAITPPALDAETRALPASGLGIAAWLSIALYLAFCSVTLINAVARPIANWDMLAYVGSAVRQGGETRPDIIHARAFETVKARVTPAQWAELTEPGLYRRTQASDPAAFVSMLPMYEVKGGYVRALAFASRFADPVAVMRTVSLISVAALLAVLAWAFHRLGALPLLGLTVPALALLRVQDLASMSTPDAPVAALAVAAMALVATRRGGHVRWLVAALLVAAVLLRPDMLVVAALLPFALVLGAVAVRLLSRERPGAALPAAFREVGPAPWVGLVLAPLAYFAAHHGVVHPGWWTHFSFSFIFAPVSLDGYRPAFEIGAYASALGRVTMRLLREETWPWLVLAMTVGGVLLAETRRLKIPGTALGLLLLGFGVLAARTIAFPLPDARVAVGSVLTLILACAMILGAREDGVPARAMRFLGR